MSRLDNYSLGRTLGEGFSAKVKLGTRDDGQEFALKIFRLDNPQFNDRAFKLLKEEVEATTMLDNKHVVKYFDFKEHSQMVKSNGTTHDVAYIAQEMISGGELLNYVMNSGAFSEEISRYYFKQMLQAVHYIHSKGFSHRDLKPENILLDSNYDLKLVDFGFACPLEGRDGSGTNSSKIGTPGYMAPEIMLGKPYQGEVVDLFALGVILFITYAGVPPFTQANISDPFYKMIAANRSDLFWRAHSQGRPEGYYSQDFKDLIICMLQKEPHRRLPIVDIIGHPWMVNGGTASAETVRQEFADRNQKNKDIAKAEADEKAAQKGRVGGGARRGEADKIYLETDEPLPEGSSPNAEIVYLRIKDFTGKDKPHQFFSHYRPHTLLQTILEALEEKGQSADAVISSSTWKINFDIKRELETVQADEDEEEEEKQAPIEPSFEHASVQIEILKVPGEEKYCVDFQRKRGSALFCYDYLSKLTELDGLRLSNNASPGAE